MLQYISRLSELFSEWDESLQHTITASIRGCSKTLELFLRWITLRNGSSSSSMDLLAPKVRIQDPCCADSRPWNKRFAALLPPLISRDTVRQCSYLRWGSITDTPLLYLFYLDILCLFLSLSLSLSLSFSYLTRRLQRRFRRGFWYTDNIESYSYFTLYLWENQLLKCHTACWTPFSFRILWSSLKMTTCLSLFY